jgi:hypothetical protein
MHRLVRPAPGLVRIVILAGTIVVTPRVYAGDVPTDAELDALPRVEVRPSFTIANHDQLSSEARACSRELVSAQWYQDAVNALTSAAHFDNCAFRTGRAYIRDRLAAAHAAAVAGDEETAAFDVGQALHGVQDFYAHSNYLELAASSGLPLDRVAVVRLWDRDDHTLDDVLGQGLISGTWITTSSCPAGTPTHAELNKDADTPGTHGAAWTRWDRTWFEASYSVARRATAAFLADAWTETPGLEAYCGPIVAVDVLGDDRPTAP